MLVPFFSWRDVVEIIFFVTTIYYACLWLKKDRHRNLLGYFYGYCFLFITAYAANLSIIMHAMALFSPLVGMLFILVHQQTLQKNFIALRTQPAVQRHDDDWLEILIRSCLVALNNNKELLCVIEHRDTLHSLIGQSIPLQTAVQDDLLKLIFESSSFESASLLWVNSQGKLLGINAQWQHTQTSQEWLSPEAEHLPIWKQDALLITSKVDALIFHANARSRTLDVIIRGKITENISVSNAIPYIKNYLARQHQQPQGEPHATHPKKHFDTQRPT